MPIWHCGTGEAFLMHVSSALDAIKKRGTFTAYKGAHEAYVEQHEAAKEVKANMSLFTSTASKGEKPTRGGLSKLPRRLLGRTALIKRRLLRRTRKARLCPMHQPLNFAKSTRPSTRRPFSQRDRQEQDRRRSNQDVSVLRKLVVFGCKIRVEQDSLGADGYGSV
jgi:hypothetical protein